MDLSSLLRPGYGLFWVANSISSTALGFRNRDLQIKAAENNEAYQLELEATRNQIVDEVEAEKIAFKRRLMELSRQNRISEGFVLQQQQLDCVEMQSFIDKYWPLSPQLPDTLQKEISSQQKNGSVSTDLNVILMHCPLLPSKEAFGTVSINKLDKGLYNNLEHIIKYSDEPLISGINFRRDACVKLDGYGGTTSSILNIHFLMSNIPTLVLSPYYEKGKIVFKGAVWDCTSPQPLVKRLCSLSFDPELAEQDEYYRRAVIKNFRYTASVLIGMIRDSYALITLGKAPTLAKLLSDPEHQEMAKYFYETTELKGLVREEYNSLSAALSGKDNPLLFEVYNDKELGIIRGMIEHQITKLS